MSRRYSTPATIDLVNALREGCDIFAAVDALKQGADPNALLFDLATPELEGFRFPALAYAAATGLQPPYTIVDRLELLRELVDRGADRPHAAGFLLAVYSDLWEPHPRIARRMAIGLHTLHTAFEPYLAGERPLPEAGR